MNWLIARAFIGKFWKEILAALLAAFIVGFLWHHIHEDNQRKAELADVIALAAEWKQANAALMAALANADAAAEKAIAEKAEAEKAAAKRLAARDKFWRDRYAHDPQAKAWAEQPIPAGVLDGLRE